mmetsp:Transcript_13015/g.35970  ORF Transcript_13015/g.35970 Transcript_13015/m.35970 type:complete len:82 (+) Transcript_13015:1258-1503(+)
MFGDFERFRSVSAVHKSPSQDISWQTSTSPIISVEDPTSVEQEDSAIIPVLFILHIESILLGLTGTIEPLKKIVGSVHQMA